LRLLLISLGVLGAHLALLCWFQADPRPNPMALTATPVQIHQILLPAAQPRAPVAPAPKPAVAALPQAKPVAPAPPAPLSPPAVISTPAPEASSRSAPAVNAPARDSAAPARGEPSTSATAAANGAAGSASGLQLPSSSADYLHNPPPDYPDLSLRLREQGQVVVRVLIGQNGSAQGGQVVQSSGFNRLDRAGLKAALGWRYVPGKVDGQARDMWFDVPISFRLPN
jgi:protein TonB